MEDSVDELKIARDNHTEFLRCYTARHERYVEEIDVHRRFYHSEHWTEEELQALGDRPALTINLAKKMINVVLGHYARTRAVPKAKATRHVSANQADLMTAIFEHIVRRNNYTELELDVIRDGLIDDRGYIDCRISFDKNALGDVELRRLDSADVLLDPEAKDYDPSTWTQVITLEWYSDDDIDTLYGDGMADKIGASYEHFGSLYTHFGDENLVPQTTDGMSAPDDNRVRSKLAVSRQYYKLRKVNELVDPMTGDIYPLPTAMPDKDAKKLARSYGMVLQKKLRRRVRWTVTAGGVVLFDDWSPYEDCFTVVPFFPFFTPGRPSGIMRDLISPQEQLDKIESQILHVINTTANSGWLVEAGSLVNMDVEELEQNGSATGLVIQYARGRNPPVKIQPNVAPNGLETYAGKARGYLAEIPGVEGLLGPEPSAEIDGIVIERAKNLTEQGLSVITANLIKTRRYLFNMIAKLVQQYYTVPRVLRIQAPNDPETIEQEIEINTTTMNNLGLFRYDVVIGTAPAHDTLDDAQFVQALQMRKAGVTIPDYRVILASSLIGKLGIAEESKRMQGLAEKSEQEQQIEQMSLELMMRKAVAEVAEVEAKVMKIQAEAQSLAINAQLEPQERQARLQLDMADMQKSLEETRAKLALQAEEMQNKVRIARIHADAKQGETRYTSMVKQQEAQAARNERVQMGLIQAGLNRRGQDTNLLNNREERLARLAIEQHKGEMKNESRQSEA